MKARRLRASLVFLGVVATVAVTLHVVNFADALILWPPVGPEPPRGAERMPLHAGHGNAIEVWIAKSRAEEPRAFVLRFYGNADRADRWIASEAASFAEEAIEFWGVNYPGYGTSGGRASLQGVADAAQASYEALAKRAGARPVFAFGTSLGTTAALHVAAHHKLAGIVIHNPPALRELIVDQHGWWNLWLLAWPISRQVPDALDSVRNAALAESPAIVLTSERDEVVAPANQRRVLDAYHAPKEVFVLPAALHNTPIPPDVARDVRARMYAAIREPR